MSTIVLGCDLNNSNDHNVQNTVEKILKKAGHTVEKLAVDSNAFASASYKKSNKGKIGVYLMAGSVYSVADFEYGSTQFKYAYFGIRGDASPSIRTENDFKTKKIKPDSDCTSVCNKLAYKTYPQMNEQCKRCVAVFGKTGEELGNNILKAMGGEINSSSSSENSSSSIKEAIKDVMYGWDGEAELFVRDDTVYIRKIPSPSTANLELIESQNIVYDSVNVTDINPSTPNYLTMDFKDKTLTLQDDYLIKRFGKITESVSLDKNIKTLDEAKEFLVREWNKIRRDNGHTLEVQVPGSTKWKHGKWCRVYLPSFNINDYMYITKVSSDDDNLWMTNLTLVDYPPSFGEPTTNENNDESNSNTDSNSQ